MPELDLVLTSEQVEKGRLAQDYVAAYSRLARSHERLRERVAELENSRASLGNALARERARPGGSYDEAAYLQMAYRAERAELKLAAAQETKRERPEGRPQPTEEEQ